MRKGLLVQFFRKIIRKSIIGIAVFSISQTFIPLALGTDNVTMLKSDRKEVVLEFQVPSFNVEERVVKSVTYHSIDIEKLGNTLNAGMPQIPVKRIPIAIPPDATPVVEVIDSDLQVYSGYHLLPVPEDILIESSVNERLEERITPNTSIYGKGSLYPPESVEIMSTGYMRSQRIAQLNIYPIQHNPVTGELRFYSKIRFRVKFNTKECPENEGTILTKEKSDGAYENILRQMLINYHPSLKSSRKRVGSARAESHARFKKHLGEGDDMFPSIKILVNEEGIYKIGYVDLNKQEFWEANLEQLDPRYLNLYNQGTEVSIYSSGEEDGSFDEGDYILFYGIPMSGVYTDTNVYWLTVEDVEGLRMEEISSPPGSGDAIEYFKNTYHGEENTIWWSSRPGGLEKDRWFWKEFRKGNTSSITYVAGKNETQGVLVDNINVNDTTNGINANAVVLILPESYEEGCRVELEPRTATVNSGDQINFNVNTFGDSCEELSFEWSWWPVYWWQWIWNASSIGSSIDGDVYTAGVNDTGGSITEGIKIVNDGYNIHDVAAVTVLPDEYECLLYMEPASAVVQSGESLSFAASVVGQSCINSTHTWSYSSSIGSYIYYDKVEIPITLNNVYPTEEDYLVRISLMGKSTSNHHILIYLNGDLIGDHSWSGEEESLFEVSLPQSILTEGLNTLDLVPIYTGNTDIYYLDWFEIKYLKSYSAKNENDEFIFPGRGEVIEIDGFTVDTVEIYDISDSYNTKRIVDFLLESMGEGEYTVKFEDPRVEELNYKALTSDKWRTPDGMVIDKPSDLSAEGKGADYIVITYDDFYEAVQPLVDYRTNKGMIVETVKITDVYDEFNYGIFDPQAIKEFLTYAYENWNPAPYYVLLVGDANIDFKNFRSTDKNYVPTQVHKNGFGTVALTDNWFACVSGDDILPDLFIGRIPANAGNQVEYAVNKILAYEEEDYSEWHSRAVFAADDDYPEFQEISDNLIEKYFPDYFDNEKNI